MSQANIVQFAQSPQVLVVKGQPVTTSLNIASVFEKEHKNVLRDIVKILPQVPEDISKLNFEPSIYTDSTGKGNPYYEIGFDGFVLLVMGYTGKKAMQFKIAYIEEFNKMRNQLLGNSEQLSLTPSTADDRKPLTALVKIWAKKSNQKFSECYRQVNAHFNIEGVADLPVAWLSDAVAFVQERIDRHMIFIEATELTMLERETHELKTQKPCPFAPVAFTEEERKSHKHIFDRLEKLYFLLEEDNGFFRLWGRMGSHKLGLSVEKKLLYEAGEAHMDAFRCHMHLAQRSLKSALEIKVNVDFR